MQFDNLQLLPLLSSCMLSDDQPNYNATDGTALIMQILLPLMMLAYMVDKKSSICSLVIRLSEEQSKNGEKLSLLIPIIASNDQLHVDYSA